MVLSSRLMLSNGRFLPPEGGDQSALKQHPEVGTPRCYACDAKGVFGENQSGCWGESCGSCEFRKSQPPGGWEVSQRATFSHVPTLASLSFLFFPLILAVNVDTCTCVETVPPKADLLFVGLDWLGFLQGEGQSSGERRLFLLPLATN